MTENEALKELNVCIGKCVYIGCGAEAMHKAIKALNEIQKYRSIGTVEEFQTATEIRNPVTPEISSQFYICPRCKTRKNIMMKSKFCSECGQAFEWKEYNDE